MARDKKVGNVRDDLIEPIKEREPTLLSLPPRTPFPATIRLTEREASR